MQTTATNPRINIDPQALQLELEPDMVATYNRLELQQEGWAEVYLDIPIRLAGALDTQGSQRNGLAYAMGELLLAAQDAYPTARIMVSATGSAQIFAR